MVELQFFVNIVGIQFHWITFYSNAQKYVDIPGLLVSVPFWPLLGSYLLTQHLTVVFVQSPLCLDG